MTNKARTYRKFDITACVADAFQAEAWIVGWETSHVLEVGMIFQ